MLGQHCTMADVNDRQDEPEAAFLEIEDNLLPFRGKNITAVRLDELMAKAGHLKRTLQTGHLFSILDGQ